MNHEVHEAVSRNTLSRHGEVTIRTPEPERPYAYLTPKRRASPSGAALDRSPYLVKRLLETQDENLFNHVKFNLVRREIDGLGLERPKILDVGCGLQVARTYLERLGLDFEYFGVDYEPRFGPHAIGDLMRIDRVAPELPWKPDVILALDVLEHLSDDPQVLVRTLARLRSLTPEGCKLIVTLPQMYRLDRFKLAHLHYPEHKIRLEQHEWREILETSFEIESVQGLGFLSVLPYLPMASKRYTPWNRLGKLFSALRGKVFEWGPLKPADLFLSNTLGRVPALKTWSNDVLFVARRK